MPLAEVRRQIDALDERLLALLNQRADLAHQVGLIKRADHMEIYAPEREEQVLRVLAEKNRDLGGRLTESAIRAIYREIMSASLALEKDLSIAFCGPEATETHQAARQKFGASVRYLPQPGIPEVFASVAKGEVDYGVVPVESSLNGAVGDTLDMFFDSPLRICAEVVMKVESHLLGKIPLPEMRRVYVPSHILSGVAPWLQQNLPEAELIETADALAAAQRAGAEPGAAAIGHKLAAEINGLQVIAPSIQAEAAHTMRFLVLGASGSPRTGKDRTAIMFRVGDAPGALYHALKPFNRKKLAMSKIESRPSKTRPFDYYFFAEVNGHATDEEVQEALRELEKRSTFVKILGTYPVTRPVS